MNIGIEEIMEYLLSEHGTAGTPTRQGNQRLSVGGTNLLIPEFCTKQVQNERG